MDIWLRSSNQPRATTCWKQHHQARKEDFIEHMSTMVNNGGYQYLVLIMIKNYYDKNKHGIYQYLVINPMLREECDDIPQQGSIRYHVFQTESCTG